MQADWYVYVLECDDETLYTGITTEPERRLREHNRSSRGAAYTRARRPVEMRALWPCIDRSEAASSEAAFKQLSRDEKLDRLEVGLDRTNRAALAETYLDVFGGGEASPSAIRPLKLAGLEEERVQRARRYRDLVETHLDVVLDEWPTLGDVVERISPRFVVGPGHIDGHGLLCDGAPIVAFDMRLIDHHLETEGFRPDVHVAHELTHALHYSHAPEFYPGRDKSPAEEVWHRLVAEGLAQRVSEAWTGCGPRLATWFGVLDEGTYRSWRERAEATREDVATALELDESIRFDDERWSDLFRGSGEPERTRLGYWWGYRIVEQAERRYDLRELLAASPDVWRPRVRSILDPDSSD